MTQALPKTVTSKVDVFSALDSAPMTPAHYLYWLLASGGTLLDGFSVVSLGIALPLLKRDYAIAPAMLGIIGSALVLGAVLGAPVGGMAADRMCEKAPFCRLFFACRLSRECLLWGRRLHPRTAACVAGEERLGLGPPDLGPASCAATLEERAGALLAVRVHERARWAWRRRRLFCLNDAGCCTHLVTRGVTWEIGWTEAERHACSCPWVKSTPP
jgi:hypothetical protein